jgi:hypothetical protein
MLKLNKLVFLFLIFSVAVALTPGQNKGFQQNKKPIKSATKTYSNWKTVKLGVFSFRLPSRMKFVTDVKGIDSPLWRYEDNDNLLDIETGQYVVFGSFRSELSYQEEDLIIDNTKAIIQFFKLNETFDDYKFVSHVTLLKKDGAKFNVSMFLYSKNPVDKELARKIFQSIKFR